MDELTGPSRYLRLKVLETKNLDIGDIVKLSNEDESFLGKVADFSEDWVMLNNKDYTFLLRSGNPSDIWQYEILYSDFDK